MQVPENFWKDQTASMTLRSTNLLKDEKWGERIHALVGLYSRFDAGIAEHFRFDDPSSSPLHRFVRYCLPFFEIHESLNGRGAEEALRLDMAAMFLWCEVWRPMDDLIDREAPVLESLAEFAFCYSRAERFSVQSYGSSDLDFCAYLNESLAIERSDDERADYSKIYKRARIFETFMAASQYPENTVAAHHHYINITGFIHDVSDFIYDRGAGKVTTPTKIWDEIGGDISYSREKASRFLGRCHSLHLAKLAEFVGLFQTPPKVSMDNIRDTSRWVFS